MKSRDLHVKKFAKRKTDKRKKVIESDQTSLSMIKD